MTEKRQSIIERWFPRKEAAEKGAELKTAAATLDKKGVKRKELPEEEKKPITDEEKAVDLGQLADEIIALATSGGDPAALREQLIAVLGQLATMGNEPAPEPEPEMATGMMSLSEDTQKAIKSIIKLNDGLITDVADITKAQDDIVKAQKEIVTAVKALSDLPKALTVLADRIHSVENVVAGRPRAASKANETKMSADADMLKDVQKQAVDIDPFYKRPMIPPVNGGPK